MVSEKINSRKGKDQPPNVCSVTPSNMFQKVERAPVSLESVLRVEAECSLSADFSVRSEKGDSFNDLLKVSLLDVPDNLGG